MAFTTMTPFVHGEQPSASRWNNLIDNDNALRDGSGFNLGNNVIPGNALATSAILLAAIKITANQTFGATGNQVITGLGATVTVPAGGRSVKITAHLPAINCTNQSGQVLSIWDGAVGSGTLLQASNQFQSNSATTERLHALTIHTPAAGSKTYNTSISNSSGTLTMTASSGAPAILLVELV